MKIEVVMPKMGESLQEGTIIHWLKKVGDKIERDEMFLEISTDKVDTEVPAPVAGILTSILAQENETIEVGKTIAIIETDASAARTEPKSTEQQPVAIKIPEADPANQIQQKAATEPIEEPKTESSRFYSPLVKSIAGSEGISLSELNKIEGSGADGRVNKTDLLKYIEQKKNSQEPKTQSIPTPVSISIPVTEPQIQQIPQPIYKPAPPRAFGVEDEIIPMDRVRQLIAEHMVYSWHTSPHVTTIDEADVTDIVRFREKSKAKFLQNEGFNLTYTPFLRKQR